ncbi:MAG TPA: ATP-binding protein [Burkholderiales bacterium]|nr:ATP-binding protein [Burkholderiales bacterium]
MFSAVKRSIRYKLALIVLATTIAALVIAGIALVVYDLRAYRDAGFSDMSAQAEIIGRASAAALAFDDPKAANEYLQLLKAKPEFAAAAIYNSRGKLFASYSRRDLDVPLPALPESEGSRVDGGTLVLFKRIVDNNEILGTVYMRADYEAVARFAGYLGIFGGVALLGLVVSLFIFIWLQRTLTLPILDVTTLTRQVVERRDFSLRAKKTTQDEIGELVDAVNGMLAEIGTRAEALEQSNRFLAREMEERQHADAEVRKLNEELEQRVADRTTQLEQANKELESFSYSVSHDLRAPLRAVVGFSKILTEDHGNEIGEEGLRKLNVIQSEAHRMGQLIDDLLAFSRLGRKAMNVIDLDMAELVRATYAGLNGQYQVVPVDLHLGILPRAKGDRILLGQVWANLLSNAVKFSSKREKPVVEVSAASDDKEHIFFVRDNGAGFDPRYQAKLFGVFQRLHNSNEFAGTGVGLALVQRIVSRHGGRVWAEGRPGEGATFYFSLPREESHGTV